MRDGKISSLLNGRRPQSRCNNFLCGRGLIEEALNRRAAQKSAARKRGSSLLSRPAIEAFSISEPPGD
jgi:hypothetical protein